MTAEICILGSGSTGNATYIKNGPTAVLIDAGFSGRELERRMRMFHCGPSNLDAIVVSHEHTDHVKGAGVLARKYGLPVYGNTKTLQKIQTHLRNVESRSISAEKRFQVGTLTIEPFNVEHDASDPLGFAIATGSQRICMATDLGYISPTIRRCFSDASVIIIEANYDDQMLWTGPYPESLKRRIFSIQGHLSNEAAGRFLAEIVTPATRHVFLTHLSQENNTPELALETVSRILKESGAYTMPIHVATANDILGPIHLE